MTAGGYLQEVRAWLVIASCVLASCSAAEAREVERETDRGEHAVVPGPRQLREVRRLVIDIAAMKACEGLENRMMTIGGGEEGAPHEGRIWLRECRAHARPDRLDIDFEATAWAYADRRAETGGGTFAVRQYVFLDAATTLKTVPELDYDRRGHYAYLWLRPIEDPRVRTHTIGPVDADPEGAWSHVVGVFARLIGQRPDDRARGMVDEEGDRRLEQQVDRGFTIYTDLCTGDAGMEMGRLREPPYPRPPRGRAGPPTPVLVRPGGLDVHGPIAGGRTQMIVRMSVTGGGPARGRLVCRDEAEQLIRAFTSGEPMPEVDAVDEALIPRSDSRVLRGGGGRGCPLYITTVPASDAPTTVAFTSRPARDEGEAIVPGCRDARG